MSAEKASVPREDMHPVGRKGQSKGHFCFGGHGELFVRRCGAGQAYLVWRQPFMSRLGAVVSRACAVGRFSGMRISSEPTRAPASIRDGLAAAEDPVGGESYMHGHERPKGRGRRHRCASAVQGRGHRPGYGRGVRRTRIDWGDEVAASEEVGQVGMHSRRGVDPGAGRVQRVLSVQVHLSPSAGWSAVRDFGRRAALGGMGGRHTERLGRVLSVTGAELALGLKGREGCAGLARGCAL